MGLAPEAQARAAIDGLLQLAGWVVQDVVDFNRNAAEDVAVREFMLPSAPCDYLLFVGGKACGVVEAKKVGITLSGAAEQAARSSTPRRAAHVPGGPQQPGRPAARGISMKSA